MEFEQIVKRLDLLEKQQRANKESIAVLSERLDSFETSVTAASKQIKTVAKQVVDIAPLANRIDQFETLIGKQRNDLVKMIEENAKNHTRVERDMEKSFQTELADLQKITGQLKIATTASLTEMKKTLKERGDEIQRMLNNVSDFKTRVEDAKRSNEDVVSSIKAMDEARKNDLKRVADLQGEIAAVRKRVDENRDKYTIITDSVRNVENRFNELLASEQERKQAQSIFMEQQAVAQVDRERSWKNWNAKFESFQKEASQIDTHIQALDEALRGAKKAQETYLELNTKLERRINEVTEMQRLAEDRLRQEWITFKTDDQKRWTGYSLSSEESFRDLRKELQKNEDRIPSLNDAVQVLQDQMHQVTDASEKQLQEMMNVVHEWMTSYQRIMGHGKKTTKK
jgi:chromosome segregation ATPase